MAPKPSYKIEARSRLSNEWGTWEVVGRYASAESRDRALARFTQFDEDYRIRTNCKPWREYRAAEPK